MKLNRGDGSLGGHSGVNIYDPKRPQHLTSTLVGKMYQSMDENDEYFKDLNNTLEETLALEFRDQLKAKPQSAGTCTMTSLDMAIYGLLYNALLEEGLSPDEVKIEATAIYKDWSAFDRNWGFDNYMNNPNNKPYSFDLLEIALLKEHNPNKADEMYRAQRILSELRNMDETRLILSLTSRLRQLKASQNEQGYQDLVQLLKKNTLERCISNAINDQSLLIKEIIDLLKAKNEDQAISLIYDRSTQSPAGFKVDIFELRKNAIQTKDPELIQQVNVIQQKYFNKLLITYCSATHFRELTANNHRILKRLLDNGASFLNPDMSFSNLMDFADSSDIKFLIQNKYLDINAKDSFGKTLLISACENRNIAAACMLIELGADLQLTDSKGKTYEEYINPIKAGSTDTVYSKQWEQRFKNGIDHSKIAYNSKHNQAPKDSKRKGVSFSKKPAKPTHPLKPSQLGKSKRPSIK